MFLDIIQSPSSIDWAQLSRFYLKTGIESSIRNVVILDKGRTMDSVQNILFV
jgi:hypothetical protein